jgi:elongation factor Ts
MAITSELIKKLRDQTGAGMMDCKKALEETSGDMNAAVEFLRKKGAAVAAKRADRQAKEGMVITRVSDDRKSALIIEVNCETDFVGRSEDFTGFAGAIADVLEKSNPSTIDELMGLAGADGKALSVRLNDLLAKVGEKIGVRRFKKLSTGDGLMSAYTHAGSKIGVLVESTGLTIEQATKGLGKEVAMQIAAMNPLFVRREEVDTATIEREMEIYRTLAKNEGKPQHILDKIAAGRIEKFYQDMVLLEQSFIMDQGKTVGDVVKEAGASATIKQFVRYELGLEAL